MKTKTIRFKLMIASLLISLAPLFLTMTFSYVIASDAVSKKTNDSALASLQVLSLKIDNEIVHLEKQIRNLSALPDFQLRLYNINHFTTDGDLWFSRKTLESLLMTFFSFSDTVSGIWVKGDLGQELVYSNNPSFDRKVLEQVETLNTAPESAQMDQWHALYQPDTGKNLLVYRKNIYDTQYRCDLRKIATVYFFVNESTFANIFTQSSLTALGDVYLFDDGWNLLSEHSTSPQSRAVALKHAKDPSLASGGRMHIRQDRFDYILLSSRSDQGYRAVQVIPYKNYTKEISLINYLALAISIVCVVLIITMTIRTTNSIAAPMNRLNDALGKFETGDFNVRVSYEKEDEIGQIINRFNKMVVRVKSLFDNSVAAEKQKKDLEISALQYQINPHFLCNILASVKALTMLESAPESSKMITALSKILRRTIGNAGTLIPISMEMDNIRDILYIQNTCHGNSIIFHIQVDDTVLRHYIPNLLLQPIVENAVFHGMDPVTGLVTIDISTRLQDDKIIFSIRDYGVGIHETDLSKFIGPSDSKSAFSRVGLGNVHQRIRLSYGDEYGVSIFHETPGTRIDICIPILHSPDPPQP